MIKSNKIKKTMAVLLLSCLIVPATTAIKASASDAYDYSDSDSGVRYNYWDGIKDHGYVKVSAANVRTGPGLKYDVMYSLDRYRTVDVDGSSYDNKWDHLISGGFISKSCVKGDS